VYRSGTSTTRKLLLLLALPIVVVRIEHTRIVSIIVVTATFEERIARIDEIRVVLV